jgi:cell wall assembly regulator SMI1
MTNKSQNLKIKDLLKQISIHAIKGNPDFYTEQEKIELWIGRAPATEAEIKDTQIRLGIELPKDVIEFYKLSNGTSVIANQTFGDFTEISKIDWLKNIQANTIEDYAEMGESYVNDLKNSIIISGVNQAHQIFIIQPYAENKEWRYWEFAHFYPGERPFDGIVKYLEDKNAFLRDMLENPNK